MMNGAQECLNYSMYYEKCYKNLLNVKIKKFKIKSYKLFELYYFKILITKMLLYIICPFTNSLKQVNHVFLPLV